MMITRMALAAGLVMILAACGGGGDEGAGVGSAAAPGGATGPSARQGPPAAEQPGAAPPAVGDNGAPAGDRDPGQGNTPPPTSGAPSAPPTDSPVSQPAPEPPAAPPPVAEQPPAVPAPRPADPVPDTGPQPERQWQPILCQRSHGDGGITEGRITTDHTTAFIDNQLVDLSHLPETGQGNRPSNAGYNNPEVVSWSGRSGAGSTTGQEGYIESIAYGYGEDRILRAVNVYSVGQLNRQWSCSVGVQAPVGPQGAVCFFSVPSFNRGYGPPTYAAFDPATGVLTRWDMIDNVVATPARSLPLQVSVPTNAACERVQ